METTIEGSKGSYVLSDDPGRLDLTAIHEYLKRAYWAENIPFDVVERSVRNSLCIGAYTAAGEQIGLVRCISDYATFCYVCDVYVLEEHRGQGLSKALMQRAVDHPKLQGLRRWGLVTWDAHGLYEQFGFTALSRPDRFMEKTVPDIYKNPR
jgi:GNAT superfamily N-acetyltransferase